MKNIMPMLFCVKTWHFYLSHVTRTKICWAAHGTLKDSMHRGYFYIKAFWQTLVTESTLT